MFMKQIFLFFVFSLAIAGVETSAQQSVRPNMLGQYELGKGVSIKSLYSGLGLAVDSRKTTASCFQSEEHGSLWFTTKADNPKTVGGILLSAFKNCVDKPVLSTTKDLLDWKTKEGIGLGNTKKDLLNTYGKPSRIDIVKGNDYRWIVSGDFKNGHYSGRPMPERGKEVIVFLEPDSVYVAEFGIDNGKIVWIFLAENE